MMAQSRRRGSAMLARVLLASALLSAFAAFAAPFDFNSDSRPDLLLQYVGSGSTYAWYMNGTTREGDALITTLEPKMRLTGHGDFNGDGWNDLVFRDAFVGRLQLWLGGSAGFTPGGTLANLDMAWQVEAVADFNKDGKPDLLLRHTQNGSGLIWYFNVNVPIGSQQAFAIDNAWIVEAVADFDGDGYPDFVFRHRETGSAFVWHWNGTSLGASNYLFTIEPVWNVVQAADWNNDGEVDLVFRHESTGVAFVWYTDGVSLQASEFLFQLDPAWRLVPRQMPWDDRAAPFDFSEDGRPDVIFRNNAAGSTYIWRMNGLAFAGDTALPPMDSQWRLVGQADVNKDGDNDVVWWNSATGEVRAWHLRDDTFVSSATLFTLDPAIWRIEAVYQGRFEWGPHFVLRNLSTTEMRLMQYGYDPRPPGAFLQYSLDMSWLVEAVGDFNNDGFPDYLFRNSSSGVGFVWYWDGTANRLGAESRMLFQIDPAWQVVQVVDWNKDGNVDLLFRNASSGVVFVWYTDGASLQGSDFLFQVDPSWEVVPHHPYWS